MLGDSAELVSNLKASRSNLAGIKADINTRNLLSDSAYLSSTFSTMQSLLLQAASSMDKIIAIDLAQLRNDGQLATKVQSMADTVQRDLHEARVQYDVYRTNCKDLPVNGETDHQMQQLNQSLLALVDIYSEQMMDSHLSFDRLDQFDLPLLKVIDKDLLSSVHRALVLTALNDFEVFTQKNIPISCTDGEKFYPTPRDIKQASLLYAPLLSALSDELTNEVDLIYQDFDDYNLLIEEARLNSAYYPHLESLRNSVNNILKLARTEKSIKTLIDAITEEKNYALLITKLIGTASDSDLVKLSDLVKVVLTLQALRIKFINQHDNSYFRFDLRMAQAENALEPNDEKNSRVGEVLALNSVDKLAELYIKDLDTKDPAKKRAEAGFKQQEFIKALADSLYIALEVAGLKEEFSTREIFSAALEEPDSKINQVLERFKLIFIKAGIDRERLMKLRTSNDNKCLKSIIKDVYDTANRYNSIDKLEAGRLIYILFHAFGKDMGLSGARLLLHRAVSNVNPLKSTKNQNI